MNVGDEVVFRGVLTKFDGNDVIQVNLPGHNGVYMYKDSVSEVIPKSWEPAVGDQYELYYQTYKIIYIDSKWVVVMNINEAYAPLALTHATFLDGKRIKIN